MCQPPSESPPDFRPADPKSLGAIIRRYPLLWFSLWLILGSQLNVTFGSVISTSGLLVAALIALLLALAFGQRRALPQMLLIAIGALGFGFLYAHATRPVQSDSLSGAATRKSQPIAIRAVVEDAAIWSPNPNHRVQDPTSQPWRTQWQIRCLQVKDSGQWSELQARSTLSVEGRIDEFLPGDRIEVFGKFRKIYPPTNPGEFDLAKHSQLEERFVYVAAESVAQITLLETLPSHPIARLRAQAVRLVDANLRRFLNPESAPLAAALVFGQRQQVDWQDRQDLMATGTLHMLAISGMHVEIVAGCMIFLCWLLKVRAPLQFFFICSICVSYAILADAKPPVIRAVVVVCAYEFSRLNGRKARLTNLLGLAAIVLFFTKPASFQNVGVHLSFLAVAAIGIFVLDREQDSESPWTKYLKETASPTHAFARLTLGYLGKTVSLSFWVWLATAPLVWANFHVVAPISIPLNVLIAIPLSISLLTGLLTGILGGIAPIGMITGSICSQSLSLISRLVKHGEHVPLGNYWMPAPDAWWILFFYGLLAFWLVCFRRKFRKLLGALLVLWLAFGLFWFGNNRPLDRRVEAPALEAIFLDVGHGTSVILHLPNNQIWLYDAGHIGDPDRSHLAIANGLWEMGVSRIDRLILSHADADHYNAVPGLIERFQIKEIVSTPQFWSNADGALDELLGMLEHRRIATETWQASSEGNQNDLSWKVIHPTPREHESDNASSMCLELEYAEQRILLPGDLDGTGLFGLTQLPDRPCQFLMAPHHGSISNDPQSILEWCRPEVVVISGNYRAARPAVLKKYASAKTLVTYVKGAVRIRIPLTGAPTVQHWSSTNWADIKL